MLSLLFLLRENGEEPEGSDGSTTPAHGRAKNPLNQS